MLPQFWVQKFGGRKERLGRVWLEKKIPPPPPLPYC